MAEVGPKSGEFLNGKLWFERRGNTLTLGLTDTAIEELGAIEDIEFPDEAETFDKGEVVLVVEGTRGRIEMVTPAAGEVSEINAAAKSEHEIVTDDPTEEGWLLKLEIQDATDLAEFVDDVDDDADLDEDEDEDEDEDLDEDEEDEDEDEDDDLGDLDEDDEDLDEDDDLEEDEEESDKEDDK